MRTKLFALALLVTSLASLAGASAQEPFVGTDGDGVPPGLTEEEEIAWVLARTPPVVVTP